MIVKIFSASNKLIMKKIAMLISVVGSGLTAMAQPLMQASIGAGITPNRVKVYIRPNAAVNGQIATLNINVAIPSGINPVPTLSISNNPYPGATFQINFTYTESGYRHYNIANLTPFNVNIAANTETEILELGLTNGTSSTTVALVTLPDGGITTPFALFYCTGAAVSNGSNLYYARGGTTVSNHFSYTADPNFGNPPGTDISTAVLGTLVSLPVKWLSFDVQRQNDNALLNWKVTNEESNNFYEVQRSLNGTDFVRLATVNKISAGSVIKEYNYTDPAINMLGATVIYYRLKQVDIDGKYSYSEIRKLNLGLKSDVMTVYPNPVSDGFYVVIPGAPSAQKPVKLLLSNSSGQLIQLREITARQAGNYYFDIKGLSLASGMYILQIVREGERTESRQLLISK